MSKVTILTKPNRIVIASKGVQGPPGPAGSGGDGLPDAPIDGNTYGRKDGEWEEVTAPTLQEVLDAGNTSDGMATFAALDLAYGNVETSFQALGMVTNAPDIGVTVIYSPLGMAWKNSSYFGIELFPDAAGIQAAQENYSINIPIKTGTMLLDSDIGDTVATAEQGTKADTAVQPADISDVVRSSSVSTIWTGTQAAYDALDPPDPNVLYVVID